MIMMIPNATAFMNEKGEIRLGIEGDTSYDEVPLSVIEAATLGQRLIDLAEEKVERAGKRGKS